MTSQILMASFAKRTSVVEIGTSYQRQEDALGFARGKSFAYLVYPTILHWEDRATEWSGIPDKVEVKIQLFNVREGSPVETVFIKGKSGLATFGGDHPQDLLPEPVEKFVSSLY